MKFVDRVGQRFGKLVVIEQAGRNNLKKVLWRCKCDCGKKTIVVSGALVTGNTSSCGCVIPNFKHGGWKNSSYNSWRAMIRRCTKPQDKDYKRYGALGITVCTRWMNYVNFVADMGEPIGTETLDRIDPTGNYEPANVIKSQIFDYVSINLLNLFHDYIDNLIILIIVDIWQVLEHNL